MRRYLLWWDETYNESPRVVRLEYFTDDKGYEAEEIQAIAQIEEWETYVCDQGSHAVIRLSNDKKGEQNGTQD